MSCVLGSSLGLLACGEPFLLLLLLLPLPLDRDPVAGLPVVSAGAELWLLVLPLPLSRLPAADSPLHGRSGAGQGRDRVCCAFLVSCLAACPPQPPACVAALSPRTCGREDGHAPAGHQECTAGSCTSALTRTPATMPRSYRRRVSDSLVGQRRATLRTQRGRATASWRCALHAFFLACGERSGGLALALERRSG